MPNKPPTLRPERMTRRVAPVRRDQRDSASARGYGRRWRTRRLVHLAREPLCRTCKAHGVTMPATDVDHIIPKRHGGGNGSENLQSLCHACHSRKTGSEGRIGV